MTVHVSSVLFFALVFFAVLFIVALFRETPKWKYGIGMLVCLILFIGVVRADKNTAQEPSQRMIAAEQSAPEAPKSTATPTPTPEPTPEPPTDLSSDTTNNTTGAYVGSTQSDKYHDPSCGWARKILQENEIWFNSIEDAKAAGYYPCGVCNP